MQQKIILQTTDGKYIRESLCFIGIVLQNNQKNLVTATASSTKPFITFREGALVSPEIYNKVRRIPNIQVYHNNLKIIEKITNQNQIEVIDAGQYGWNLYDHVQTNELKKIIQQWKSDQKIYLMNTEPMPRCDLGDAIAGVASGTAVADMAYQSRADQVIFFDYNQKALEYQQELIYSQDRQKVFFKYMQHLTMGRPVHVTPDHLKKLDIAWINTIYNRLQKCRLQFVRVDFSQKPDINRLFGQLPAGCRLWISNVIHYAVNLFTYDPDIYNYIQRLSQSKNISLFPYTQVEYES